MKWLNVLRQQVELNGQKPVAEKLGVSNAVVSQVVNEKYPGDMNRIQALVESVYMSKKVLCPVLGEIAWHACHQHQKNEFTSNPQKLRIYRACRSGCDHSDLPVTQNIQLDALANRGNTSTKYDANAVISRLSRQADNEGGRHRLIDLLQDELQSLAARFNKLVK